MMRKLRTLAGRAVYTRRKAIVEPVFGQIKLARGLRLFNLRGDDAAFGLDGRTQRGTTATLVPMRLLTGTGITAIVRSRTSSSAKNAGT
jgi:hypothetical protein